MDRISNLPDEILHHIGSFFSAKEAAFTMVLSKRFQNLFIIIQQLHLNGSVENGESLEDIADRVLALPFSSRVRTFSLKWWFVDLESAQYEADYDHINRCLRDVLKRGVMDLELKVYGKEGYTLPLEVFTCETVEKLSLGSRFGIENLPKNAYLPFLKSVSLYYVWFNEFGRCCAFKTLLDASPQLEELDICGVDWGNWKWCRIVSSKSLKRLTFRRVKWGDFDDSEFKSISFDTPSLALLYYSDYVPTE